jgi:hypothetical protein
VVSDGVDGTRGVPVAALPATAWFRTKLPPPPCPRLSGLSPQVLFAYSFKHILRACSHVSTEIGTGM